MGDAYAAALDFVNQEMVSEFRWVKASSFVHTKLWNVTFTNISSFSATDGLDSLEQMEYFCCTDTIFATRFLGASIKKNAEFRA